MLFMVAFVLEHSIDSEAFVVNRGTCKNDGRRFGSPALRAQYSWGEQPHRQDFREQQQSQRQQQQQYRPIPSMPSELFQKLTQSQLELLAHSLTLPGKPTASKIKSIALYLPQENVRTGQLEFLPAIIYPDPKSERVFIAPEASAGVPPTLPKTLTKLPGFSHATALLPGYPMVSSDEGVPGVGVVEEVLCDAKSSNRGAALSIPLFSGPQTVGVLLVWPTITSGSNESCYETVWTDADKKQISRAAQSLSVALSMDNERTVLQMQTQMFRTVLSDSLHQVKNPLQALRTYSKILQRRVANTREGAFEDDRFGLPQLLELAQHLTTQSDRMVDLLLPIDSLVNSLEPNLKKLGPATTSAFEKSSSLVRWEPFQPTSSSDTIEYVRERSKPDLNSTDFSRSLIFPLSVSTTSSGTAKNTGRRSQQRERPMSEPAILGDFEMAFVPDVLDPVITTFQAIAMEEGIDFDVIESEDDMPGVMLCPKSLQEAVCNVLDNAFRYCALPKETSVFNYNPSPKVRLRLFSNQEPLNVGVTILIEDNGPGIRPTERDAVFERGFRSPRTKSLVEGSGIGLDIGRSLVKRMGGKLDVADNKEIPGSLDGTVMRFVLFRNPCVKL
jgi:signal transduction histidine kinase